MADFSTIEGFADVNSALTRTTAVRPPTLPRPSCAGCSGPAGGSRNDQVVRRWKANWCRLSTQGALNGMTSRMAGGDFLPRWKVVYLGTPVRESRDANDT